MVQGAQRRGRAHVNSIALDQKDRSIEGGDRQAERLHDMLAKHGLCRGELQPAVAVVPQAEADEAAAQHAIAVEKVERLGQVGELRRKLHAGRPKAWRPAIVCSAERWCTPAMPKAREPSTCRVESSTNTASEAATPPRRHNRAKMRWSGFTMPSWPETTMS